MNLYFLCEVSSNRSTFGAISGLSTSTWSSFFLFYSFYYSYYIEVAAQEIILFNCSEFSGEAFSYPGHEHSTPDSQGNIISHTARVRI